ncbi:hypothetical protein [Aurantiacibacter rhizosphaerae]|uniref:Cytochrome c n=1 Tax=Aurantiacibacter rhizosphaerae TaxID=2691582 RepID=A0A844XB59_9SPHN|nr:hypothetical protein [Aurantiacibacter rhizosphaerae]MWV26858.1 hypothetical protein [Aurantiacibacter rhizosphaerae]
MRVKAIVLVGAALAISGCGSQGEEAGGDAVRLMMVEQVQPTSETYWNAVQYISDENGSREVTPQNDAEWERTAEAARQLASYGEQLQQPQYAEGHGSDWMAYSQGLVEVAGQAEAAANAKDPAKVLEIGGTLYNVCSSCHEKYMSEPAGISPSWPDDIHEAN